LEAGDAFVVTNWREKNDVDEVYAEQRKPGNGNRRMEDGGEALRC
jgi:hypothetical protein